MNAAEQAHPVSPAGVDRRLVPGPVGVGEEDRTRPTEAEEERSAAAAATSGNRIVEQPMPGCRRASAGGRSPRTTGWRPMPSESQSMAATQPRSRSSGSTMRSMTSAARDWSSSGSGGQVGRKIEVAHGRQRARERRHQPPSYPQPLTEARPGGPGRPRGGPGRGRPPRLGRPGSYRGDGLPGLDREAGSGHDEQGADGAAEGRWSVGRAIARRIASGIGESTRTRS